MQRRLLIGVIVLAVLLLAGLGATISAARSARSLVRARRRRVRTAFVPSLALERSTAQ
jgi:hypothetical protein